jgi:hypothetical protein
MSASKAQQQQEQQQQQQHNIKLEAKVAGELPQQEAAGVSAGAAAVVQLDQLLAQQHASLQQQLLEAQQQGSAAGS